ncbi:MAG: hypothetical protein U1F48_08225 [Burkholderiales bacterium]
MDGIRKVLTALVILAAGIFWATHAHAARPVVADCDDACVRTHVASPR